MLGMEALFFSQVRIFIDFYIIYQTIFMIWDKWDHFF